MKPAAAPIFRDLLRGARPALLAAAVLFYTLGGGIASYLAYSFDWLVYWAGQAAVLLLLAGGFWLSAYFDRAGQPPFAPPAPPRPSGADEPPPPLPTPRVAFLQAAAAALTAATALVVTLLPQGALTPAALLFLALAFALVVLYAVPPFRLAHSGYGELVLAVLIANLTPALGFVLQSGELHRLMAMLTFPLTFLLLAALLAVSLRGYLADLKSGQATMMTRVGWQRGMTLHNALIAAGYLLLAVTVTLGGLSWPLAWPAFLSLPVGVFQIWQMNGIAAGAKPRWRLLSVGAAACAGLTAYFITLALWIN